jgi:hypothetical protein
MQAGDDADGLAVFGQRLHTMEVSTIYPLLLFLFSERANETASKQSGIITDLESYLVQRLVEQRARLLVVERTGWGKSLVYFMATRLLRERGTGPTLLISPLLALMHNQLMAADRLGVRAAMVNSTNEDNWNVSQNYTARCSFFLRACCSRCRSRLHRATSSRSSSCLRA